MNANQRKGINSLIARLQHIEYAIMKTSTRADKEIVRDGIAGVKVALVIIRDMDDNPT